MFKASIKPLKKNHQTVPSNPRSSSHHLKEVYSKRDSDLGKVVKIPKLIHSNFLFNNHYNQIILYFIFKNNG